MEQSIRTAVCLICFETTEKHICIPPDARAKFFNNCNTYLHSTLTNETLKNIQPNNEDQLPICNNCYYSGSELIQLSEQLTAIQKHISDLIITFSMAVFHRRSRAFNVTEIQNNSASVNNPLIIEFNEACLPPNIFLSNKNDDQNVKHLSTKCKSDFTNVKLESNDLQFNNLYENHQPSIEKNDRVIQFTKENADNYCGKPTEQNKNLVSEIKIVHVVGGVESKNCTDRSNAEIQLTMSELLKSVKMPHIQLERIKIEGHEVDDSAVNLCHTTADSCQKVPNKKRFKEDQESIRNIHHRTHSGKRPYNRSLQKFASRSYRKIHEKTNTDKKSFQCLFCQKVFDHLDALNIHKRIHTGEKPFNGSLVGKKHNNKRHEEIEKPYQCSYCEKCFSSIYNLKAHKKLHTGEKPFECSFCKKKFARPNNLKQHERTHTGEKPFECSFCKRKFARLGTLKQHERTHTGEKPFECQFCKNRFSSLGGLQRHEKTHTGRKRYQCTIDALCEKRFFSMDQMKLHEKRHTEEKSNKCLYCEKTFAKMNDKKIHENTHLEKRSSIITPLYCEKIDTMAHLKHRKIPLTTTIDFKCSFCEMRFGQDEDRISHEEIHNGEAEIVNEDLIIGI